MLSTCTWLSDTNQPLLLRHTGSHGVVMLVPSVHRSNKVGNEVFLKGRYVELGLSAAASFGSA
jgi:hypothetical protein